MNLFVQILRFDKMDLPCELWDKVLKEFQDEAMDTLYPLRRVSSTFRDLIQHIIDTRFSVEPLQQNFSKYKLKFLKNKIEIIVCPEQFPNCNVLGMIKMFVLIHFLPYDYSNVLKKYSHYFIAQSSPTKLCVKKLNDMYLSNTPNSTRQKLREFTMMAKFVKSQRNDRYIIFRKRNLVQL
jgi:hypothetical protein